MNKPKQFDLQFKDKSHFEPSVITAYVKNREKRRQRECSLNTDDVRHIFEQCGNRCVLTGRQLSNTEHFTIVNGYPETDKQLTRDNGILVCFDKKRVKQVTHSSFTWSEHEQDIISKTRPRSGTSERQRDLSTQADNDSCTLSCKEVDVVKSPSLPQPKTLKRRRESDIGVRKKKNGDECHTPRGWVSTDYVCSFQSDFCRWFETCIEKADTIPVTETRNSILWDSFTDFTNGVYKSSKKLYMSNISRFGTALSRLKIPKKDKCFGAVRLGIIIKSNNPVCLTEQMCETPEKVHEAAISTSVSKIQSTIDAHVTFKRNNEFPSKDISEQTGYTTSNVASMYTVNVLNTHKKKQEVPPLEGPPADVQRNRMVVTNPLLMKYLETHEDGNYVTNPHRKRAGPHTQEKTQEKKNDHIKNVIRTWLMEDTKASKRFLAGADVTRGGFTVDRIVARNSDGCGGLNCVWNLYVMPFWDNSKFGSKPSKEKKAYVGDFAWSIAKAAHRQFKKDNEHEYCWSSFKKIADHKMTSVYTVL